MMAIPFRRLPNGIPYRVLSAYEVEAEKEREALKAYRKTPEYKAELKEARLQEKRDVEIDRYHDRDAINRLINGEMGTKEWDIIESRETYSTREGKRVSGLRVAVMYKVSGEDFGLEEGEEMEDVIRFSIYRDPANPSKLRISY